MQPQILVLLGGDYDSIVNELLQSIESEIDGIVSEFISGNAVEEDEEVDE